MARRMLFEVAGEQPGADLMETPRTVPLPLALVGITVAALAEAMQVRAANEPPAHLGDVITTYAQTLSGVGQITAGAAAGQLADGLGLARDGLDVILSAQEYWQRGLLSTLVGMLEWLAGEPDAAPWTLLDGDADCATFYAGAAEIELYRSDCGSYRDNLATEAPKLWTALRATGADPPFAIVGVTADPNEGEALATAGTDLVEALPMPASVRSAIAQFVAAHHVEDASFSKRVRDRVDPEALARRAPMKDRR